MKKIFFVVAFGFIAFTINAQTNKKDWQNYTDSAYNFKMQCPNTWVIKTTNPKARVVFLSPNETDTDAFKENLNVLVREIPSLGGATMADITKAILDKVPTLVDDYKLNYNKKIIWSGKEGVEICYTGISKTTDKLAVYFIQRVTYFDGLFYTSTFTAENKKPVAFEKEAKQIFDSMVW